LKLEGADFANPRVHIDSRSIGELADSIAKRGLMYPLQVWRTKEKGKMVNVVVDGGRRLRAIAKLVAEKRANGLDKGVEVRIIEAKSLEEARIVALTGNIQRVDLKSYEIAKEMAALKEAGLTGKEIAEKVGKSPAWVSKQLKAFDKCTDWVKKEWKSGKLPDDDVFNLSKLAEGEQNKRLKDILEHRTNGAAKSPSGKASPKDRGKAREVAKGKKDEPTERTVRPGTDKLERYAQLAAMAPKKDAYVQGMKDAFLFALGKIGPGEFGPAWTAFAKKHGFYTTDAMPEAKKGDTKKPIALPPAPAPAAKKSAGKKSAAKKSGGKKSAAKKLVSKVKGKAKK
jgi:ParB/RepB/Spo0J family partition protein